MPLTSAQQIAIDRAKLEAALADPAIADKRHIYDQLERLPIVTTAGSGAADVASGIDESLDIEAIKSLISDVKAELTNQIAIADLLIQDSSATARYFIRQDKIDQTTGVPTVAILNLDGTAATPPPVLPLSPVKAGSSNLINEDIYVALAAGTGYTAGDSIANVRLLNGETGLVVISSWYNVTTGTPIASPPPIANLKGYEDRIEELLTAILAVEATASDNLTNLAIELGKSNDTSIPGSSIDPATIKGIMRLTIATLTNLITKVTDRSARTVISSGTGARDVEVVGSGVAPATGYNALVVAVRPDSIVNVAALPAGVVADIAAIRTNTARVSQFSYQLAEDSAGVALLVKTDSSTGISTYINTTTGAAVVPTGSIELTDPTSNGGQVEVNEYTVLTTSAGNWAPNQILTRVRIGNTATGAFTSTIWQKPDGTVLATIPVIDVDCEDTSRTLQTTATNTLGAIGNSADVAIPANVNDPASLKGLLRFIAGKLQAGSQGFGAAISTSLARKTEIAGLVISPTANFNLLDLTNVDLPTDVRDYRTLSVTIERSGVIGTTSYVVTGALDAAFTRGITQLDTITPLGVITTGTFSTTQNTIKFNVDVSSESYIKVARTGSTLGTDRATALLSQLPINPRVTATLPANQAIASIGTVGQSQLAPVGAAIADTFFATVTANTTSNGSTPTWGTANIFSVDVLSVSGTAPTLTVTVQETLDGIVYTPIYTFSAITAIGTYFSPVLAQAGRGYRYVQTVGGTSPSFGRNIYRYPSNLTATPASTTVTLPSNGLAVLNSGTISANQSWISSFTSGCSCQIEIDVTAISGTNAQSIVTVFQAINNSYQLIYTFEPITVANGARIYRSPYLPISGANLRVVETVTGTSPSITRSIVRNISHQQVNCAIGTRRQSVFNLLNAGIELPLYGRTRRLTINNRSAALHFIQIHDKAAPLVNGDIPIEIFLLPATSSVPFTVADLGEFGTVLAAATNPRIAISTTFNTYTAPTAIAANSLQLFAESL